VTTEKLIMMPSLQNNPLFSILQWRRIALGLNALQSLRNFYTFSSFALACVLIPHATVNAQAQLLKDLNPSPEYNFNETHQLTDGGVRIYYVDQNALWVSYGTTPTTVKIKSFASVRDLTMVGTTLYFVADDGSTGQELWRSDGTSENTIIVKDIHAGIGSSDPFDLTDINGTLFFSANTTGLGRELWKSNGTPTGTIMVRDILKGTGSSNPGDITNANGLAYFSANDGTRGYELWRSDGTSTGTMLIRDIRSELKVGSNPKWLTYVNGTLFFTATDATTGNELWKTDGTSSGTTRVKDIRVGTSGSGSENLIEVNGMLLFTANDGIHGDELWRSDGTEATTFLVKDLNPGSAGSNSTHPHGTPMHAFTDVNGILFFVASKGWNYYIYRSDGTTAGTLAIQPAFPVGLNRLYPSFTFLNGYVYFVNTTSDPRRYGSLKLWKMLYNGSQPSIIEEFTIADDYYDAYQQAMIEFDGNLYTFARLHEEGWNEEEDWRGKPFQFLRSDGTAGGTVVIKNVEPLPSLGSNPHKLVRVNDLLYIGTSEATSSYSEPKQKLYRTDGTTGGTFKIMDIEGSAEMIASGSRLYFASNDTTGGSGLFYTEGTPETTHQLSFVSQDRIPEMLTDVNGIIYYADRYAYNNQWYGELWKSDGTVQGTRALFAGFDRVRSITRAVGRAMIITEMQDGKIWLTRTINTGLVFVAEIPSGGTTDTRYYPTATIDLVFYFVANDGAHGNEIWRSDGTTAGTYMLFDHNTTDPLDQDGLEDDIRALIRLRRTIYFSAKSTEGTWALYSTDGTPSYQKIADMPPVVSHVVSNGLMYLFTRESETSPSQLWVSNGTSTGTQFITELKGEGDIDYSIINNIVYFNTRFGGDLMRSDGTTCGTYAIETGVVDEYPVEALGTDMLFGAYTPFTGNEPFVYRNISSAPSVPCTSAMAMEATSLSTENINTASAYPNPFTHDFTLRVDGDDDAMIEITVLTPYGESVQKIKDLKSNVDYASIGAHWKPGMYVLKIVKDGQMTTQHVVKK
jgi:ELWxxDGT repeat protein